MKTVKFIMVFILFDVVLNASNSSDLNDDSKSLGDKTKQGRVSSPHGLIPILQISRLIKKCEDGVLELEEELRRKRLPEVRAIPLIEVLENQSSENNGKIEETTDDLADFQEESGFTFKELCKKVSSISLQLNNKSNKANTPLSRDELRIQSLLERLASLKREYHLPIDNKITCFVSDLDGESGHRLLEIDGVLQELEDLAAKKESSADLSRDHNGITTEGSTLGESKKSSLRLEIPRALSFKYLQIASLGADSNQKKETKRQSIFGEALSSDEGSEEEKEEEQ